MRKLAKTVLVSLIVIAALAAAVVWDVSNFLNTPISLSEPRTIQLKPGESLTQLADQLYQEGGLRLSRYVTYLDWYARATGQARRLKAGEYRLSPGMKPPALVALLVSGKVVQHKLTVVDGWTFAQMWQVINTDDAIKHTLKGKSPAQIMAAIGHAGQSPEGLFAPDTYYFPRGLSDTSFLKRAYAEMRDRLDTAWSGRAKKLPLKNAYQTLILASMVERETGAPVERKHIAGVFVQRLKQGMRLQSDPTVIYGLGNAYNGKLHQTQLHTDTPYNTYTRQGLPPTPICLPGEASLEAAAHPDAKGALYFVAKGDGTHKFSATLAEHNRAVNKYVLGKTKQ